MADENDLVSPLLSPVDRIVAASKSANLLETRLSALATAQLAYNARSIELFERLAEAEADKKLVREMAELQGLMLEQLDGVLQLYLKKFGDDLDRLDHDN